MRWFDKDKKGKDKTVYSTSSNVADWSEMPIIQDVFGRCPRCKAEHHGVRTAYKDGSRCKCNHCQKSYVEGLDPATEWVTRDPGAANDPHHHRPGCDQDEYDRYNDPSGKHRRG